VTAYEVGALVVLIFSPWILTTSWIMGGLTRDYIWHRWGFDLLRTR
jgi:hypothetical protein